MKSIRILIASIMIVVIGMYSWCHFSLYSFTNGLYEYKISRPANTVIVRYRGGSEGTVTNDNRMTIDLINPMSLLGVFKFRIFPDISVLEKYISTDTIASIDASDASVFVDYLGGNIGYLVICADMASDDVLHKISGLKKIGMLELRIESLTGDQFSRCFENNSVADLRIFGKSLDCSVWDGIAKMRNLYELTVSGSIFSDQCNFGLVKSNVVTIVGRPLNLELFSDRLNELNAGQIVFDHTKLCIQDIYPLLSVYPGLIYFSYAEIIACSIDNTFKIPKNNRGISLGHESTISYDSILKLSNDNSEAANPIHIIMQSNCIITGIGRIDMPGYAVDSRAYYRLWLPTGGRHC
jgi:hypothetical protein